MNFTDTFKITGDVVIKKYDGSNLIETLAYKNLVVTTGKKLLAKRLLSDTPGRSITIIGASGTGTVATLTFAAVGVVPFIVGATIVVSGMNPSGYNGTYTVTACTTTSVQYANTTTGFVSGGTAYTPLLNSVISKMALGTGIPAANLSDVALVSQVGEVAMYDSYVDVSGDNAKVIYIASFPPGNSTSTELTEAGLFNSSNVMLCRTVFPIVSKLSTDTLEIFWTLTIN